MEKVARAPHRTVHGASLWKAKNGIEYTLLFGNDPVFNGDMTFQFAEWASEIYAIVDPRREHNQFLTIMGDKYENSPQHILRVNFDARLSHLEFPGGFMRWSLERNKGEIDYHRPVKGYKKAEKIGDDPFEATKKLFGLATIASSYAPRGINIRVGGAIRSIHGDAFPERAVVRVSGEIDTRSYENARKLVQGVNSFLDLLE